jgi:hypothetical protein
LIFQSAAAANLVKEAAQKTQLNFVLMLLAPNRSVSAANPALIVVFAKNAVQ